MCRVSTITQCTVISGINLNGGALRGEIFRECQGLTQECYLQNGHTEVQENLFWRDQ